MDRYAATCLASAYPRVHNILPKSRGPTTESEGTALGLLRSRPSLIGRVLESLKKAGRVSVLLVEQYLEFALKLADRYYVMEKGAIVLRGTTAHLDKEAIKPYLAF